ncbi:hypothetical protein FJ527_00975 [Mesorhizobium sp. B2-4-18]|uniref:hypothetical protein n=1 Tax=Mesorhizobium sp. B2-4-18 TaxID=2589931 RepID=UPI0011298625|nr:hypothetical protein [Mesorhizobium sp. B2-4-18]TPK80379.1 hypothetical protein FJ527_00975 [Mesorhizobium sp. B2-4-18]
MQRTLLVNLTRNTWPRGKAPPRSLLPVTKQLSVDILDMMVRIGSLAIPVTSMGLSINAWWAWLRYASAFADGPGFLLKSSYVDLDAHQKTILSDDFGMGVALSYLVSALDLQTVFDGRYFVQFLAPAVGAKALLIAKNGQFKSPDFIGQDSSGRWHAIECKGTQTSSQTRLDQIKAGRLQKTNVVLPPAVRGQKLISALLVGRTGGGFESSLLIEDPEGDTRFRVRKDTLSSADEAGRRATLARALGLIGYPAMAATIAAPYGQNAYDRETSGEEEQLRLEVVQRKRAAIGLELQGAVERSSDRFATANHIGREVILSAPDPINTPEGRFTRIRARLAMPLPIFTSLRERLQNSEPAGQLDGIGVAGIKGVSAETTAKLTIGSIFEAEVELLR